MRVVWRGTISFGLVTIPVALYVATESKNVPSQQIHVNDGGRVQYKRVCSIDGAEVPYEEIGRGYESTTGELVVLSDVDLAALPAKTSRSIEIVSFLPQDGRRPHLLRPQLLRRARTAGSQGVPADAGRAAQDRAGSPSPRSGCATARSSPCCGCTADVLVLATMLWPDEVRQPKFPFLAEDDEWVSPTQELAMAEALIDSLADEQLDTTRYRDVHRETLTALIDAKATGRAPTPEVAVRRGTARPVERALAPASRRPSNARRTATADGAEAASRRHGQEEGQGAGRGRT